MSLAASDWDALKLCKPKLEPSIEYESRVERDEAWLILRNDVSGEHVRLNASATDFLALIDGEKTIESLFSLSQELGFSIQQVNALVGTLCASGMITLGSLQEQDRILAQIKTAKTQNKRSRFGNPLALKFALHNPDKWLGFIADRTQRLPGRLTLTLSLGLIVIATLVGIANSGEIIKDFTRVATSPTHWWLYALLYPALKAVHELSHALVIKRWGGSVHETGITLLVLMPIPYVDASDAWMFPSKFQRMVVSAAGMLAECTLAAIGLFVYLGVQPGFLQELGFAVFVMGSLSTILFNANPLLKFDGYYILQDALDMPNLSTRSAQYCRYLFKRYLYGVSDAASPVRASGERRWLFSYGVLAFAYRIAITITIALFLASKYFVVGVALAVFAFFQLLVNPLLQLMHYLRTSPELAGIRKRTVSVSAVSALVIVLFIGFVPMPSSTRAEGVVWVPNQAQIFAAQEGFIENLLVEPGAKVVKGQLLFRLHAPALQTAKEVAEAELTSTRISYRKMQRQNTAKAQSLAVDIASLESELASLIKRLAELEMVAANDGQFFIDEKLVVAGRRVEKGERLGYVVNKGDLVVKAVLEQQRVERMQSGVEQVYVRLADQFSKKYTAILTRQVPAGSDRLPSPALAYNGRGGIAVASETEDNLRTLEPVFHIELALPEKAKVAGIGGRAYVTLLHQPESLGKRFWRSTRQLLLKQLTV